MSTRHSRPALTRINKGVHSYQDQILNEVLGRTPGLDVALLFFAAVGQPLPMRRLSGGGEPGMGTLDLGSLGRAYVFSMLDHLHCVCLSLRLWANFRNPK